MMKLKLLAALMLGSTLIACGGGSSGGGGGNDGPDDIPDDDPPEEGTQIEIQNETLPLIENFAAADTADFFSESYKALNTPSSNTIEDDEGNESTLMDPHPSFYYPTCCLWSENPDTGEVNIGEIDPESTSWKAGNGYLALIDSARMSIGQILSDLTDENANDRKSDTSDGAEGANAELGSWGELDLSEPYRVSFCLNDNGPWGSGFSNLELYVDNNSGGRQADSLWSTASLLLREEIDSFEAGNRVVVEVPGDAYMMDNEGNRVGDTIAVIPSLDGDGMPVGTSTSYLQLRVSSGGYAVISNLVVEHQDGDAVDYAECTVNEEYVVAPQFEGEPFAGLPLTVNLDMSKEAFLGEEGESFLAMSDDPNTAFYVIKAGNDATFIENQAIRFGNARWTMGDKGGNTASDVGPNGDIDLTQPYTIRFDVNALPEDAEGNLLDGNFQVQVDNNTTGGANSIHGNESRILNVTISELQQMMEDSGSNTIEVSSSIGTETSFFHIRCDSGCGEPTEENAEGITISNIQVVYQDSEGGGPDGISETFDDITSEEFFSVEHRHVSSDASTAFFDETGGTNLIDQGAMYMDNSRFTAGDVTGAPTTSETTEPQGDMDLSQAFRIQFDVVANDPADPAEDDSVAFFVYLDNNTTSSGNSLHDFDSRIVNVDTKEYEVGQTYTYEITEKLGTENSFLQFRCESGCKIAIDNLIVEPM